MFDRQMESFLAFLMSFRVTPRRIRSCLEATSVADRRNLEFVTPEAVRCACVQLDRLEYRSIQDYALELLSQAQAAVEQGAQVVVYPEYVGLLPFTLVPGWKRILRKIFQGDGPLEELTADSDRLRQTLEGFQDFLYEAYLHTFSTIARQQHVCIVAGSTMVLEEDGCHHRSVVFGPDGEMLGSQEQVNSIGVDRLFGIRASDQLEPIETPLGPLGIVIGSDAYYFEPFQILRAKGAKLIAVPTAQAGILPDLLRCRAKESGAFLLNGCYSCGKEPGRAGIYAPLGMTAQFDGVLARLEAAEAGMLAQRLNLTRLEEPLAESEPNPIFLRGDYLHSYRYCGKLPLVETAVQKPQPQAAGDLPRTEPQADEK